MSDVKKRLPYMPFFVADYLAKTRRMTLAERGAYTDLLFQQWVDGPLPKDPEELALLIRCKPREFAKVWPAIKRKFTVTADGLVNIRLEEHRAKAIKVSETRSQVGRIGGIASAAARQPIGAAIAQPIASENGAQAPSNCSTGGQPSNPIQGRSAYQEGGVS